MDQPKPKIQKAPIETCPQCEKTLRLCVCSEIRPLATRHHVLILQHPQEPDKELGTARLTHLSLPNSTLKVGLSWPNLKAALGRESKPQDWAVLYLGSGIRMPSNGGFKPGVLELVTRQGEPLPDGAKVLKGLQGIILLDGTWSQAKTIWWRNAWLLKCRRAILTPNRKSLYGVLRKEPRKECLSTLESAAYSLEALGEDKAVPHSLVELFRKLLERKRPPVKPGGGGAKTPPASAPQSTEEA